MLRQKMFIRLFPFIIFLIVFNVRGSELSNLFFPPGTSLSIAVSISQFLPEEIGKGFAYLVELDLSYPVVAKSTQTVQVNPFMRKKWEIEKLRRNQAIKNKQRKIIKAQVQNALEKFGYDGPRCMKRFQCELNTLGRNTTALEDILLIIFKNKNLDCRRLDISCPFSLLQVILHSQQINDLAAIS